MKDVWIFYVYSIHIFIIQILYKLHIIEEKGGEKKMREHVYYIYIREKKSKEEKDARLTKKK